MTQIQCPMCTKPMELRQLGPRRFYWRCFFHGVWVPLYFFQWFKGVENLSQNLIWARKEKVLSNDKPLSCAICRTPMQLTPLKPGLSIVVDQCRRCNYVWFDIGEIEKIPTNPQLHKEFPKSVTNFQKLEASHPLPPLEDNPMIKNSTIHPLMYLGLPVENDAVGVKKSTLMTYLLIAVSFGYTVIGLKNPNFLLSHAFDSLNPLKNNGFNLIYATLMHGGWIHYFSNMYFLLILGDNIEDQEGPWQLFIIFWICALAGYAANMALHQEILSVGASGGIAGLISYYAFSFPKNRFRIGFFHNFQGIALSVNSMAILFLWILFQVLGGYLQLLGLGSINYVAHIAGALMGLAFYIFR